MRRTCRNGRRRASPQPRGWSINPQSPAMVRGESHRATYRMHHFQSSGIYETGSRGPLSARNLLPPGIKQSRNQLCSRRIGSFRLAEVFHHKQLSIALGHANADRIHVGTQYVGAMQR